MNNDNDLNLRSMDNDDLNLHSMTKLSDDRLVIVVVIYEENLQRMITDNVLRWHQWLI